MRLLLRLLGRHSGNRAARDNVSCTICILHASVYCPVGSQGLNSSRIPDLCTDRPWIQFGVSVDVSAVRFIFKPDFSYEKLTCYRSSLNALSTPSSAPMEAVKQAADAALAALLREAALEDVEADWTTAPATSAPASLPAKDASSAISPHTQAANLPPTAAAKLYTTRVRAAQAEVTALKTALQDREEQLSALESELQSLRTEAASWAKERRVLEAKAERAGKAAEVAADALRRREEALLAAEGEARAGAQGRRAAEAEARAREARLDRALEEAARYRRLLEEARAAGAAHQDVPREEHARVLAENRALAGQRAELAAAFGKAMRLVGVLEAQKLHLAAGLEAAGDSASVGLAASA